MPKINRIRLVNITYDCNYIKDILFDLYDGSNALFNLANGSGKSVLVQMIFQPILPCMSIDKRKITDYIPKGNAPAYMLIEWLLDDTEVPTYFLTGIAMVATRERSTDFEENGENLSVKYFTFTNEYTDGCDYDIANLPIVQLSNDKKLLLPYNESYNKLKAFAEKDTSFKHYHRTKFDEYRKSLLQHRVYTSEWKLLAKINQKEGGLSTLFEQCKTSDALFDKCILKTIADTVPEDRKHLVDCLTQLIKSILSSDVRLTEKELFESFNIKLDECLSNFDKYCSIVDEKTKKEKYLLGVLKHLQNLLKQYEDEQKQAQKVQDDCTKEFERINQERASQEYYETLSELENAQSKLEKNRTELQECSTKVNTSKRDYQCMEASKYYHDMKSQQNTLEAILQTIETIKHGERDKRLTNLGYSLYIHYRNAEGQSRQSCDNLAQEVSNLENKRNDINTQIKSESHTKDSLNQRKFALDVQLKHFADQETHYSNLLGELPERDLFGNLSTESVEKLSCQLEDATQASATLVESLLHEEKILNEKYSELQTEESDLNEKQKIQQKSLSEAEQRLTRCNDEISKLKNILHDYEISEEYVFDRDGNLNVLQETLTALTQNLSEKQSKRREYAETLRNFKNRQLHASRRFAELLESNNIGFQTGEDYLIKQSFEYQSQLLDKNPMLPYCFILDDSSDFEKALQLEKDTYIDRLCLVIRKDMVDQPIHFDGVKVYSLYNFESINPNTRPNFENHLNSDISKLDEQIATLEKSRQKCFADVTTVRNFSYSQQDFERLNASVIDETNRLNNLEGLLLKCKASQKENIDRRMALKDSISKSQEDLKSCQDKQSKFEEYLKLAEEDLHHREEFAKTSNQLELVSKNINALDTKLMALTKEIESKRELRLKASIAVSTYLDKRSNFEVFARVDGELIDAPTEQLDIEYRNLHQEANLMLAQEEEKCKELSKKISNDREALKRYPNLSESDYSTIDYDEFKLERLKERYYDIKNEYDRLSNEEKLEISNIQRCQDELTTRLSALGMYDLNAPLQHEEIHGNYTQRLNICQETKRQAKQSEEESTKQKLDCQKDVNRLERILNLDVPNFNNIVEVTETVDINKEKEELKSILSKLATAKDTLVNSIEQARTFKTSKNSSIVDIIANMDSISLNNLEDYYESFHTYEKLSANKRNLDEIIKCLTYQLQEMENNRNNMVVQSYAYAKKLYEEVMWLPTHSHVTLHDKNIRVKTLDFNIPTELDETSNERVKDFVNGAIDKLRKLSREENFNPESLEKLVNDTFSDRVLFNVVTGKDTIKVKLCKFQKNSKNSSLESWESAYSGGEKFMAYFVLYSTLTAYTRNRFTIRVDDHTHSVFLIDNPFGATSSAHLLNAFVDITKRFNLQLICFSDLKQSSITNRFDLIYQLSLKDVAYQKAHLTVDGVQNQSGVQPNSSLEHISLKEGFTQLSFVDI